MSYGYNTWQEPDDDQEGELEALRQRNAELERQLAAANTSRGSGQKGSGEASEDDEPADLRDQILQAERKGDWERAFALKGQQLHELRGEPAPQAPAPEPPTAPTLDELAEQIGQAEQAGKWAEAMRLKGLWSSQIRQQQNQRQGRSA